MDGTHDGCPFVCTIAGSDSGGGAGIQADLKTFSALGVWGLTVITAITAQNPNKVSGIWPLDEEAVRMQIKAVLDEYEFRYLKTGMLANAAIVKTVAGCISGDLRPVIDPVMISTSGTPLMEEDAIETLVNELLPKAFLVTPNLFETELLSGLDSVRTGREIEEAGKIILDLGPDAVLIKGGHGGGNFSTDILVTESGIKTYKSERYPFEVHGTGCCLSAAITAFLARGENLDEACSKAKRFVSGSILHGIAGKSGCISINPSFTAENYNKKY